MSGAQKYYGKYRGTVINNIDPMQIGRIMAMVPDVAGFIPSSWAMPCVPKDTTFSKPAPCARPSAR